jgi:hypothetical protein
MKKLILLLLVLGIAAAVYLVQHPKVWNEMRRDLPLIGGEDVTRAYKWRDAQGRWQVTGDPPGAGVDFEVLEFAEDVNVLPLPPRLDEPAR